ncbi:hypothetical protein BU15DRAFT_65786 [Melanogaster broomeanus]|nr:hypothetical protein BU15DRAFT_65786 [Melanogaster broomeanus]
MAPWPETPYSCLSMPYASKTDPAPHKGTYRFKNGPVVSGPPVASRMDPPPHERNHNPTDGPVTSKGTPLSQKWTRRVGDGRTASKLDASPQERPRRLKSGPEVLKIVMDGPGLA